jgi:hypothetical protein
VKAFQGKYDDQVDALVQFLEWLDNHRGRSKVNRALGRPTRPEGGSRALRTVFRRRSSKDAERNDVLAHTTLAARHNQDAR